MHTHAGTPGPGRFSRCAVLPAALTALAVGGAWAPFADAAAPFAPRFEAVVTSAGHVERGEHPGLQTVIRQAEGEEPLQRVEVTLPQEFRPEVAIVGRMCRLARLLAGTCLPSSRIGEAQVTTPLVAGGLRGPVRLAAIGETTPGTNGIALPYAVVELGGGGLALRLDGAQRFLRTYRLRTTFAGLPPVPVSRFVLRFYGGAGGALRATRSYCAAPPGDIDVRFVAQDGRTVTRRTPVAVPGCARLPRVTAAYTGFSSRPSGRVVVRRGVDGPRLRRVDVAVPWSFPIASTRRLVVRVDGRTVSRTAWSVADRRVRVRPPGGGASRVEVLLRRSTLRVRRGAAAYGDRKTVRVFTGLRIADRTGGTTAYRLRSDARR